MKVGDLVKVDHINVTAAIVVKIHEGRQGSIDILTPNGIQKRIWENHAEVINEG